MKARPTFAGKSMIMALPPTEVRYSKYAYYFILAVTIFVSAGMLLSLRIVKPSWQLSLAYLLPLLVMAFFIRNQIRKVRSNAPVLIFESHALTVYGRKTVTIPWSAITEWKIIRDKNEYLMIRTASGKVKVGINWLEVKTQGIKSLMETYIREPGPNGGKR